MSERRPMCARRLLYGVIGLCTVLLMAGFALGLAVHLNFFFLSLLGLLLLAISCPLHCILQTCQLPSTAPESPPQPRGDAPPSYELLFVVNDDPPPSYDKALQFANLPRVHLLPQRQPHRLDSISVLKF
ncbi:hypothetical protein IscW_ISCW002984 [Ixodes scapularis]|uniref:Uncharacterized protein n=1 Tax=Ixodes scapularis TaxID=6945 RepID=B7PBQ4_IXOSC|nr:hypothetical protein IscW_ISCW002984 [Ixodes scapularis]|eukprot:XP_002408754.1 hypothetical protein IscW_ISCW002984 [Ixodes scapularis]